MSPALWNSPRTFETVSRFVLRLAPELSGELEEEAGAPGLDVAEHERRFSGA